MKKFLSVLFILILFIFSNCNSNKKRIEKNILAKYSDSLDIDSIASYFYLKKDYVISENLYSNLIFLSKSTGMNYYRLAYSNLKNEKFVPAIYNFKMSVALDYKKFQSYLNISCCYAVIHKDSIAIEYAKNALAIDSNSQKAKNIIEICQKELQKKYQKFIPIFI